MIARIIFNHNRSIASDEPLCVGERVLKARRELSTNVKKDRACETRQLVNFSALWLLCSRRNRLSKIAKRLGGESPSELIHFL